MGWGLGEKKTKSQSQSVVVRCELVKQTAGTYFRLGSLWYQGHQRSFRGAGEKVFRWSSILGGIFCFGVAQRTFKAFSVV